MMGYQQKFSDIGFLTSHLILSLNFYICNKTLGTCIFPARLKFSEGRRIFKKWDKSGV